MKRMALLLSLLLMLALAMPAFAGASNNKRENDHQIAGVLEGGFTFVILPNATTIYDVDALGNFSGVVKDLGHTEMFTFNRLAPNMDGTGSVVDGLFWIVAASHNTIQGTYTGKVIQGSSADKLVIDMEFVITGGTGRFEKASGTIHARAYATITGFNNFAVWPATWVLEGNVDY